MAVCTDAILTQLTALVGEDGAAAICADGMDPCVDATSCAIAYLSSQVATANSAASDSYLGLNVSFLLFSGYLVFIMQLGFAMLCAGLIRSTAQHNILLKNVIDACAGGIVWYLVGYGFAFGKSGDGTPFIGNNNFALSQTVDAAMDDATAFATIGYQSFYFQWAFAAATATITSGAVAERCTFLAYILYSCFMTGFVYPVVVHSVWSAEGWLSPWATSWGGFARILETGAIDFAGSGVVHMTGGVAAFMGAWLIGPRFGRFRNGRIADPMDGYSAHLVVLGTMILWLGWYGFNPGSNLVVAGFPASSIVSRVAVTTTLAACAGGCVMLVVRYLVAGVFDLVYTCNGVLGGLVAITAGCSVLEPWAAVLCGAIAPLVFCGFETMMHRLEIDDAVAAAPLHAGCGAFGVLYVGLLAKENYVQQVYGASGWGGGKRFGIFYGGHGQLLLCQFIEVLFITAWVAVCTGLLFGTLKFFGRLRIDAEVERVGLDVSKHGRKNVGNGVDMIVSANVAAQLENGAPKTA